MSASRVVFGEFQARLRPDAILFSSEKDESAGWSTAK